MTNSQMTGSATVGSPARLAADTIARYRADGFVHIPSVLSAEEVQRYRAAAQAAYDREQGLNPTDQMFKQIVNIWQRDDELRNLTLHPRLASLAGDLAGIPLRIWHDQLLIKQPHNGAPTEYHQDGPYWPHADSRHALSAWVALVDVPVERGCMTFIPGQQNRRDLAATDISDTHGLFEVAPDLIYQPRVTIPLRAGDVTFHSSYTPHTANANNTDDFRLAHVNIYIDRDLHYNGRSHPCTNDLGLQPGQNLPDDSFPPVP